MRSRSAPTSVAARQFGFRQHFRPGEHGAAGKQRRDVPAAIDGGDMKGIGEAVERQRARQRNDMAAIDQPPAEAALLGGEQIEMDARGVLIEPRRDHVLGFFDGHAVDMIDLLADLVVAER